MNDIYLNNLTTGLALFPVNIFCLEAVSQQQPSNSRPANVSDSLVNIAVQLEGQGVALRLDTCVNGNRLQTHSP